MSSPPSGKTHPSSDSFEADTVEQLMPPYISRTMNESMILRCRTNCLEFNKNIMFLLLFFASGDRRPPRS